MARRTIEIGPAGQIIDQMKSPPIKNLVFKGGGPKGFVYLGAADEFEKRGILASSEYVCGSSAGAITAMLLGTGHDAKEAQKTAFKINLLEILDTPQERGNENNPRSESPGKTLADLVTIAIQAKRKGAKYDLEREVAKIIPSWAMALMQVSGYTPQYLVDTLLADPSPDLATEHLKVQKICDGIVNFYLGVPEGGPLQGHYMFDGNKFLDRLRDIIKEKVQHAIDENPELAGAIDVNHITFKDIHRLATDYPELGFKDMVFTGTNVTEKKVEYFSHHSHPDMEVALAVRISMSLPGLFKSVKIGNNYYQDGGMLNNFPTDVFDREPFANKEGPLHQGEVGQDLSTLCVGVYQAEQMDLLWKKKQVSYLSSARSWGKGKIFDYASGVPITAAEAANEAKIKTAFAERTLMIPVVEGVSLVSFDISDENKKKSLTQGHKFAKEWCNNYLGSHLHPNKYIDFPNMVEQLKLGQLALLCKDLSDKENVDFSVAGANADQAGKLRDVYLEYAKKMLGYKAGATEKNDPRAIEDAQKIFSIPPYEVLNNPDPKRIDRLAATARMEFTNNVFAVEMQAALEEKAELRRRQGS